MFVFRNGEDLTVRETQGQRLELSLCIPPVVGGSPPQEAAPYIFEPFIRSEGIFVYIESDWKSQVQMPQRSRSDRFGRTWPCSLPIVAPSQVCSLDSGEAIGVQIHCWLGEERAPTLSSAYSH